MRPQIAAAFEAPEHAHGLAQDGSVVGVGASEAQQLVQTPHLGGRAQPRTFEAAQQPQAFARRRGSALQPQAFQSCERMGRALHHVVICIVPFHRSVAARSVARALRWRESADAADPAA